MTFMAGLIGATIFVAVIIWLGYCVYRTFPFDDDFSKGWTAILIVSIIVVLAGIFTASANEEAKGPCLETKTGYMYNPSTKMTQPYTYCASRGEWKE